jgi:hypothetical protein
LIRRHWNVHETPELDRLVDVSPSIRLGTTEVPLPENDGLRGPVGRIIDYLFLRGTTPEYVLPVVDADLTAMLVELRKPTPQDPDFEVVGESVLLAFLQRNVGSALIYRDEPPLS